MSSRSFRFAESDLEDLKYLARKWRMTKAAVLRRLVLETAKELRKEEGDE